FSRIWGVCVSRMRGRLLMSPRGSRLPHPPRVAVELLAAEGAALEEIADRVGLQLGLLGQRVLQIVLGAACRPVAVVVSPVVVPPGALVPGGAVEDLEAQVRVLEADADQLDEVFRLHPDRQPALVERLVAEVADPQAQYAQPVLVGVERAQRLAEGLADAIAGVWPHGDIDADVVVARVEA